MIQRPDAGNGRPGDQDADAGIIERVRQLLELRLRFSVPLAERDVSLPALENYSLGSIILLPDADPSQVRLEIEGEPIASGTVVRLPDGRLGLRIDEVLAARQTIEKLAEHLGG